MNVESRFVVRPGREIAGRIHVPGDKSMSHRVVMIGAIAEGVTEVSDFLASEDCLATLAALETMGVTAARAGGDRLVINGVGLHGLKPAPGPLDLGNSGTAMRLLTGLLAGQSFASQLTGDASLRSRPMERVAEPLRQMGAGIDTDKGKPPVRISGGHSLTGITYASPVPSAQVKSALLLAGLYASGETRIIEPAVTRDHTERMLPAFGVAVARGDLECALLGPAQPRGARIAIPGDLSSAAFPLAAGVLGRSGPVMVEGIGINPTRRGVLDVLEQMGASIETEDRSPLGAEPVADLTARPATLRGISIPEHLVPLTIDEFPLLFALAACADGVTRITGAGELRAKESDRIGVMVEGLQQLGIVAEEMPDGAVITGGQLTGGTIDSHGDHRVAMAFAVAAITASDPVTILNVDNVATSFPGFVAIMQQIGLDLTFEPGES